MNKDIGLLDQFGIDGSTIYWSETHQRYERMLKRAILSRRMTAVIGGFGSGKSTLVGKALEGLEATTVCSVNNAARERLTIGQIVTEMIFALDGAAQVRRDYAVRQIQLRTLLGEHVVRHKKQFVVILENAHRMHANTLLAIKDLRESLIYNGQNGLFSVILVGQEGLRSKIAKYGEVGYRTRTIDLIEDSAWMNLTERVRYLNTVYGKVLGDGVAEYMAAIHPTVLQLDHALEKHLEPLAEAGIPALTMDMLPRDLREQRLALDLTQKQVSSLTGLSTTKISDLELGKETDPEIRGIVQQVLDAQRTKAA